MSEYLDTLATYGRNRKDYKEYLELNYSLYNGYGEQIPSLLYKWCSKNINVAGMQFDISYDRLRHFDIISPPAKGLVGEQQRRRMKLMACDATKESENLAKQSFLVATKRFLEENVVGPKQQQIMLQYMQQYGIQDVAQMPIEAQQQMNSDVQRRLQEELPKKLIDSIKYSIQSPSTIQTQEITNVLAKKHRMKELYDSCFLDYICGGLEVAFVGIENNNEVIRPVDIADFRFDDGDDVPFVEDGDWAIYREDLSLIQLMQRTELGPSDLDGLKDYMSYAGSGGSDHNMPREYFFDSFMGKMSLHDRKFVMGLDLKSRKDQQTITNMMATGYGSDGCSIQKFETHHYVWKAPRKLYKIGRFTNSGELEYFFRDESYEPQPTDMVKKEILIPYLFQARSLGSGSERKFIDKGLVPYQYKSIDDPFECKLPYVGNRYNKFKGHGRHMAPIDIPKNIQFEYNVEKNDIDRLRATDVGNILLTSPEFIPDNTTPQEFYMNMKYGKMAMVKIRGEGGELNPMLQYMNRKLELGNDDKIASRLAYTYALQQQASLLLGFNPDRLGVSNPYATATQSQENILRATDQTREMYTAHDSFIERATQILVRMYRNFLKYNPEKQITIFNDHSMAAMTISKDLFIESNPYVFITTSPVEESKVNFTREFMLNIVQQTNLGLRDVAELIDADNMAEIKNISAYADEKRNEAESMAFERQMELQQQAQNLRNEMEMMKKEFEMRMKEIDYKKTIDAATISSDTVVRSWDQDNNKIHDMYQSKIFEMETKMKMLEKQLASNERIKKMELDVKKMDISVKKNSKKL